MICSHIEHYGTPWNMEKNTMLFVAVIRIGLSGIDAYLLTSEAEFMNVQFS